MFFSTKLENLINALKCLPGVGNKTAQRMAFHLLEKKPIDAKNLANHILDAVNNIKKCQSCQILTENILCNICADPKRNKQLLCIVSAPSDVLAIEDSHAFKGLYFVLNGYLSPIDGIGPNEIGVSNLIKKLDQSETTEVILATNSTVEGEATAFYLSEIMKKFSIEVSRIAYGIPIGGELEYTDIGTIYQAITNRKTVLNN